MVIDFFAVNQDSYLSLNMGKEEKKELGLGTSFIVTVQKTHYLIVWVILQLIVLLIMMLLLYNVQIQVCIYLIVWVILQLIVLLIMMLLLYNVQIQVCISNTIRMKKKCFP